MEIKRDDLTPWDLAWRARVLFELLEGDNLVEACDHPGFFMGEVNRGNLMFNIHGDVLYVRSNECAHVLPADEALQVLNELVTLLEKKVVDEEVRRLEEEERRLRIKCAKNNINAILQTKGVIH